MPKRDIKMSISPNMRTLTESILTRILAWKTSRHQKTAY